jgi:predicted RNA-binding protein with PUA-like domain
MKQYWLMKSEPVSYSIDHLQKDKKTPWTGVRNFLARNYMQKDMHIGDEILFYHSSCAVPGVYGIAKVASAPYPDASQYDKKGHYFEPRATIEKPVWYLVDIAFVTKAKKPLPLTTMRETKALSQMKLLQPGSRLSITPVTKNEFDTVVTLLQ